MTLATLSTLCSRYLFPLSIILIKYSSKGAHTWFAMGDNRCICHRLTSVIGDGEKVNDVVFCGAVSEIPEGNVVFFPGDVQVKYLVIFSKHFYHLFSMCIIYVRHIILHKYNFHYKEVGYYCFQIVF